MAGVTTGRVRLVIDFVGFGVELLGHQTQPFGTREVEATPRDMKAIFSLATQELRIEHVEVFEGG
jgi:hypothetical protein